MSEYKLSFFSVTMHRVIVIKQHWDMNTDNSDYTNNAIHIKKKITNLSDVLMFFPWGWLIFFVRLFLSFLLFYLSFIFVVNVMAMPLEIEFIKGNCLFLAKKGNKSTHWQQITNWLYSKDVCAHVQCWLSEVIQLYLWDHNNDVDI